MTTTSDYTARATAIVNRQDGHTVMLTPALRADAIAEIAEALRLADNPRAAELHVAVPSQMAPEMALPSQPLRAVLLRFADERTFDGRHCVRVLVEVAPRWVADDDNPNGGGLDGAQLLSESVVDVARRLLA